MVRGGWTVDEHIRLGAFAKVFASGVDARAPPDGEGVLVMRTPAGTQSIERHARKVRQVGQQMRSQRQRQAFAILAEERPMKQRPCCGEGSVVRGTHAMRRNKPEVNVWLVCLPHRATTIVRAMY